MGLGKLTIISFHLLLIFILYKVSKSWCSPSGWYTIWSFCLIIPSLFIYDHKWKFIGILWWQFSCLICLVGHIIGLKSKFLIKSINCNHLYKHINYKLLLFIYFALGLGYVIVLIRIHGFSLNHLTSLNGIYELNNHFQGYRYSKSDGNENYFQQICLSFTYALPICGGYLIPIMKSLKSKISCIFLLFPNLLISFVNNTKSGVIIAVILFFTGFIIRYCEEKKKLPEINCKFIIKIILILFIFLILMFFITKLRYNSNEERSNKTYIILLIRDYIFGCVVNFDENFLSNEKIFIQNSNILTGNYFWIEKYGVVLTLVIWFMQGLLTGYFYKNLFFKKISLLGKLILIYAYLNSIYFFTYLPFAYTTVCIGCFVLYPIFMLSYENYLLLEPISKEEYL